MGHRRAYTACIFLVVDKHVVILGSSLVHWAHEMEKNVRLQSSFQLHDVTVHWVGRRGAGLEEFHDAVKVVQAIHETPACIIVHLGANDLARYKNATSKHLAMALVALREKLCGQFPQASVLLSELIYRAAYRYGPSWRAMHGARQRVNTHLHAQAKGHVLMHRYIDGTEGQLIADGVHLTEIGNRLFLKAIFQGIEVALGRVGEPAQ